MKVLISGVMMALLASVSANAAITVEQRKAACEKSADKVWVKRTETCVPKDVCSDQNLAKSYCKDLYLTSYERVPYGASIRPIEVINTYVQAKGLKCNVDESGIFIISETSKYGDFVYKNIPCKGDDYMVFRFDDKDIGGNVTDVLCEIIDGASIRNHYEGWPTICSNISQQSCNKIKGLVGNKVRVEFVDDMCEIGEWAPDATMGYIWQNAITVK